MNTIEKLKELESELNSLSKVYSGTLVAISLDEECRNITKVLKFLEEKKNGTNVFIINIFLKII